VTAPQPASQPVKPQPLPPPGKAKPWPEASSAQPVAPPKPAAGAIVRDTPF